MAKAFTDDELQQIATYVAYRFLEVERGLRDKACLRRYLSTAAYAQQQSDTVSRYGKGWTVRQSDLGRMTFQRPSPNRAFIAVPARQQGDQWGALVMEMQADARGVWRITELTRAQDRNLARPQSVRSTTAAEDPGAALDGASRDLSAAKLARRTATERFLTAETALARIAPERPAGTVEAGDTVNIAAPTGTHWVHIDRVNPAADGTTTLHAADGVGRRLSIDHRLPVLDASDTAEAQRTADEQIARMATAARSFAHWDRIVTALEDDRAALSERRALRETLKEPRTDDRPAYLVRVLGSRPSGSAATEHWDQAADAIEAYRQRWHITATDTALGPPPPDKRQRDDREATIDAVRHLMHRRDQAQTPAALGEVRSLAQKLEAPARPFQLEPHGV